MTCYLDLSTHNDIHIHMNVGRYSTMMRGLIQSIIEYITCRHSYISNNARNTNKYLKEKQHLTLRNKLLSSLKSSICKTTEIWQKCCQFEANRDDCFLFSLFLAIVDRGAYKSLNMASKKCSKKWNTVGKKWENDVNRCFLMGFVPKKNIKKN